MILALIAGLAAAPAPPAHVRQKVVALEPIWLAQPTREDIDQEYPPLAKQWHDNGRAVVECTAQDDGTLAACSVISETPDGEGFGEATLRLTPRYRLATTGRQGRPIKAEFPGAIDGGVGRVALDRRRDRLRRLL